MMPLLLSYCGRLRYIHALEVVPYGKSSVERARVKAARAAQRDDAADRANLRRAHRTAESVDNGGKDINTCFHRRRRQEDRQEPQHDCARRKELYEKLYPETISVRSRGGPGRGKKNQSQIEISFVDDASRKIFDGRYRAPGRLRNPASTMPACGLISPARTRAWISGRCSRRRRSA
jgi:hypothetical protein